MPIGVPRIIYCWGEELPAQWTDIYNFIFRRRMVFLMQYLDDELCNQICGLLINIHMEDRSKELEKKEMEKSGLFKSYSNPSSGGKGTQKTEIDKGKKDLSAKLGKNQARSVEDLLTSDQDFAIDDNHMLEQYTLQKITTEWLNWNAQFFDYSDEPYLYYLAEILSKDFAKDNGNLKYTNGLAAPFQGQSLGGNPNTNTTAKLISALKKIKNSPDGALGGNSAFSPLRGEAKTGQNLDIYAPFRLLANFAPQNMDLDNLTLKNAFTTDGLHSQGGGAQVQGFQGLGKSNGFNEVRNSLAQKEFKTKLQAPDSLLAFSEKALGQRQLKRQYMQERLSNNPLTSNNSSNSQKVYNYLDTNSLNNWDYARSSSLSRKQTQQVMQEEESKKVFMIINSFGGSVGNGITVHDALQFIKAGSLTLGLGVAASAASLALAGGTIGERYVTEGCHVMIHQPEGGINGQASDIWIDSQEIMKIRLDVAEIYSLATYRPRHKILRDLDRDFYLTAMETIYYGLADEIATNEVMHSIIELTQQAWDFDNSKQERLLESRDRMVDPAQTQSSI
jgi:ATP-dependent Clp protease, protease subunit